MLREITIRDFVLVDQLTLEFSDGMTALTGETGAGKSILLDAIGLCLGDRADSAAVRPGAEKADIAIEFDVASLGTVGQWLQSQDMDAEESCILRRVVHANGRSKAYINGAPAPIQQLRELGELLVDIQGQHAHQALLRPEIQRQLLDDFSGKPALLKKVEDAYDRCALLKVEIRRLEGSHADYDNRLDLLRYQVKELSALELDRETILSLDEEQRRLAHAGESLQVSQGILSGLYEEDGSAQSQLSRAVAMLDDLKAHQPGIDEVQELFNNALVQLEEGCDNLRRMADGIELDPERLSWVDERISTLNDLSRKHRVKPEELPERLEQLEQELSDLERGEEKLQELRQTLHQAEDQYRAAAVELSYARQRAASDLNDAVNDNLAQLGMGGAELRIRVSMSAEAKMRRHGMDTVNFAVRTNPGQAFGPLNQIASGGELSRFGLAIQVATARISRIPTLIFDEADSGVGGAVAEVIGKQLRKLGENCQVFCVTHLPQVAAQAHHQLQVSKQSDGKTTRTAVRALGKVERIDELARMLGGVEITDNTRRAAEEMLAE